MSRQKWVEIEYQTLRTEILSVLNSNSSTVEIGTSTSTVETHSGTTSVQKSLEIKTAKSSNLRTTSPVQVNNLHL